MAGPGVRIRAWWWARRALRWARSGIASQRLDSSLWVPPAPDLPPSAWNSVHAYLERRRARCVERALVRQAWLKKHGSAKALILGIGPEGERESSHAWLEGEEPCHGDEADYSETVRLPPLASARKA